MVVFVHEVCLDDGSLGVLAQGGSVLVCIDATGMAVRVDQNTMDLVRALVIGMICCMMMHMMALLEVLV